MNILKRFRFAEPPCAKEPARGYTYNEDIDPPMVLFMTNDMKSHKVGEALEERVYRVIKTVARSLLSDPGVREVRHEELLVVDMGDKHVTVDYVCKFESSAGLDPCALTHEGIAANSHIDGFRVWALADHGDKGWSLTLRIKVVV